MEDLAFSKQIIERKDLFPWLKIFLDKILKKFPNDLDKEILQFLIQNIEKEVNSLANEEDTSRKEALFEVIYDLFLHFWWRVRWDGKKKWRKCWKIAYSDVTYSYDQRTKCIEKLLYIIMYLGILLSNGCSESVWTENVLKALQILPSFDDMICNSLLRIKNLEAKFHHVYMAVLKHVLCSEVAQNISEPVTYIKILLLLRRLKNYTKDKVTLSAIKARAVSIKAPPDTSDWLSSLEVNLKVKKHKNIAEVLLGKKCPETIIRQLYRIITGREDSNPKADSTFNESSETRNQKKVSDYERIQPNTHSSHSVKDSWHRKNNHATNPPSSHNSKIKIRLNHKMLGGFNSTPNSAELNETEEVKRKNKSKSISNEKECNAVASISKASKVNDFLHLSFGEISNFPEFNIGCKELDCAEEVKDMISDFINQDSESGAYLPKQRMISHKNKNVQFHNNSLGKRMKLPSKSLEDTEFLSVKETFIDNCETTKSNKKACLISPEKNTQKYQKSTLLKLVQPESSLASKLSLSPSVENGTILFDTNYKTPQSNADRFYFELSDSNSTTLNESLYPLQNTNNSAQHWDMPLQSSNKSTEIDFKLINSAIAGSIASTQDCSTGNKSKAVGAEKLSNIKRASQKLCNDLVCSSQLDKNKLITCNNRSDKNHLFSPTKSKGLAMNKHHLTDSMKHSPERSKILQEDNVVNKSTDESICIMQDENASHCLVDCKVINDYDPNNSFSKEGPPSIKVFINVTCKEPKNVCNPQKEHVFGTFRDTSLNSVNSKSSVNYFNALNPFNTEKSNSKMPNLTPYFDDLPLLTRSLGDIATPPDSELDMNIGGSIKRGNTTEATTKFVNKEFHNTRACSTPKNTPSSLSAKILTDHSDLKTPNTSECESSNEWSLENTNLTNSLLVINSLQNSSADDVLKQLNSRTSFVANKANTASATSLCHQQNTSISYRSNAEIYSEAEFSDDSTISCPSVISGSDPELKNPSTIGRKSRKGSKGTSIKKTKVFPNKRKKLCAKQFKSKDLKEEFSCIKTKRYNLRSRGNLSKPNRLGDFIT